MTVSVFVEVAVSAKGVLLEVEVPVLVEVNVAAGGVLVAVELLVTVGVDVFVAVEASGVLVEV